MLQMQNKYLDSCVDNKVRVEGNRQKRGQGFIFTRVIVGVPPSSSDRPSCGHVLSRLNLNLTSTRCRFLLVGISPLTSKLSA